MVERGFLNLTKKMTKRTLIIILAGLLTFGGMYTRWRIGDRQTQREWPNIQLKNATTLGAALSKYQDQHGSYPSRLVNLVDGGTMNQHEFNTLQFQSKPKSHHGQWLYKPPNQLSDIAIVAPTKIYPWNGHSGYTVAAYADGSGMLIPAAKQSQVPAWTSK